MCSRAVERRRGRGMVLNYSAVTSMVLRSPVSLLAPCGMSTGMNACEQITGYNPAFWSLSVESGAAQRVSAQMKTFRRFFRMACLFHVERQEERAKETLDKCKTISDGRFKGTGRTP